MNNKPFPRYLGYDHRKLKPSVLSQHYPMPSLERGEVYYPSDKYLSRYFTSDRENQLFGAVQFCSFLDDTIEVEHNLVIPAIASLRRLPFCIPDKPKQDLFKTATDEGYHAEQSLAFLTALEKHFNITQFKGHLPPLFMQRLDQQCAAEENFALKNLILVLNGIVTETRISEELGDFTKNHDLSASIRDICRSHAQDEVVHASQFQALGIWLWDDFDEGEKAFAAGHFIDSTIARSLPDIDNIIMSFAYTTRRSIRDAAKLILSVYDENILLEEMLIAARPTLKFLDKLGIGHFISTEAAIEKEREKIALELSKRRMKLYGKLPAAQ